jgi:hypothetical protein
MGKIHPNPQNFAFPEKTPIFAAEIRKMIEGTESPLFV